MPSLGLAKRSPYARTPFAAMTNEGAGEYYGRTGTMPKSTYGGKFGLGLTNPDNRVGAKQVLANATGNQYAPMGGPGLGLAPTTAGGFSAAMQQQNPGGVHFGGTLPVLGLSSGGQMRPQFTSGPMAPQGYASAGTLPNSRYIGGARPGESMHLGLTAMSPGMPGYSEMQTAKTRFNAAHPNDIPLEQRYHSLGLATPAERGVNRFQKAVDKTESRRLNNGIVNFEQRLGLANPAAFQQRKVGEANIAASNTYRTADLGLRRDALSQQSRIAMEREKGLTERAKLGLTGRTGIDPATGQPIAEKPTAHELPAAIAKAEETDWGNMGDEEVKAATAHLPPETQKRILEDAQRQREINLGLKIGRQAASTAVGGLQARAFQGLFGGLLSGGQR
jgi:hypothetical protein